METKINLSRLVFALASPSLEELPSGLQGGPDDAAKLLDYHIAWTSLWSPQVLGLAGFLPESRRTDTSGLDVENALILVPELALSKLDQPLEERLQQGNNLLQFSSGRSRRQIVHQICCAIGPPEAPSPEPLSQQAVRLEEDFCAFGYAVMQVQQMARKLRYSFNLDWMIVSDQLVQAAQSFNRADYEQADRWLSAAYDSLSQERDRYCSQQGHLVHLLLTAPTTTGKRLSEELHHEIPTTLFATNATLKKVAQSNPEGFEQLKNRIEQKSLALAGGFSEELRHTYLSEQSLNRSFRKAQIESGELGISYPKVLLPFHPSIPAHLPALARLHGFEGAILAKFLDGMIPEKEHAKLKWQSTTEGPAIDTILGHVLDAADPSAMLEIGSSMAKQLDYHQVPTLVLAHWPGRACSIFDDLARIIVRTPALGKWILADEYFESTSQPYWTDQFGPSHFPFATPNQPELLHAMQVSLIHLHRSIARLERLADAIHLCNLVSNRKTNENQDASRIELLAEIEKLLEQLDNLATHEDRSLYSPDSWIESTDTKIQSLHERATRFISDRLSIREGWTVMHPASHPRRVSVQLPTKIASNPATNSDRLIAASPVNQDPSMTHLIIDVPPFGFATIPSDPISGESSKPKPAGILSKLFGQKHSIAQTDGSLANEFMEIQVDPKKGHLRSVHIRDKRGNRLSGMVSMVAKPAGSHHRVTDNDWIGLSQIHVEQKQISDSEAMVVTRGVFETGQTRDTQPPWIEQTVVLRRGFKSLEVSFAGGGFDRFSSTPVWRMIWPSEAATLQMWSHGNRTKWLGPLQANIELIEIDDVEHKVYFATGGLSYHLRQGANQLQTLLPVRADGSLNTTFMLGIDWQRPWETAIDLFQPAWVIPPAAQPSGSGAIGQPQSAWLAQCNHPNLRFSFLPKDHKTGNEFRNAHCSIQPDALIWVSEGSGKSSTAKISLPKNVREAWKVDFSGQLLDKIHFEGSDLLVPYSSWEKSVLAVVLEN